jgi:hypothetical protein
VSEGTTVRSFRFGDRENSEPEGDADMTVVSLGSRRPVAIAVSTSSKGVSKSSWSLTLENAEDWWYSRVARSGMRWKNSKPFPTVNLGGSISINLVRKKN